MLESLESLDLVLFAGDAFSSRLIEAFEAKTVPSYQGSYFSHVALVVKSDILPTVYGKPLEPGRAYIYESTMSGLLNDGVKNVAGEAFFGTQVRDLEQVIKAYTGMDPDNKVAFVRLRPEWRARVKRGLFQEVFQETIGVRYQMNPVSLCCAGCRFRSRAIRKIYETLTFSKHWMFCSELVAHVYLKLGLFSDETDPELVLPQDFAYLPHLLTELQFL